MRNIWMVLWNRAANDPSPFEIDEVAPEVARVLGLEAREAACRIRMLLQELDRLPDNEQFFEMEGNAVVPRNEFLHSTKDAETARSSYPFEL